MAEYINVIPTKPGHYVYRLWAADGTCLYVGLVGGLADASRISDRFWEHKKKHWWSEVAWKDVATFASAGEVVAEEKAQIAQHKPVHNRRLHGTCAKGHDLMVPGAKYQGRRCKRCMDEYISAPTTKAARLARDRARRNIKNALNRAAWNRAKRRPGPGQQAMW